MGEARTPALLLVYALGLLAAPGHASTDHCFTQAASRYGVDAGLLRAVASAESDMNSRAVNTTHIARTKTVDIGLMQINTGWLSQLARYGIQREHLFDPCINVNIGAWILASEFAKRGATWDAVGAYNAACSQLKGAACTAARSRYAWRVYRQLRSSATDVVEGAADPGPTPSLATVARPATATGLVSWAALRRISSSTASGSDQAPLIAAAQADAAESVAPAVAPTGEMP